MTRTATAVAPVASNKGVPGKSSLLLQRKCACGGSAGFGGKCEDCAKDRPGVQRSAAGPATGGVPPIVHEVLRSPGQPLDAATRAYMEPRFGHDFSRVRVHSDHRASAAASSVNAHAFTSNQSIVFGTGEYAPQTLSGRRLVAHELTHVVQQKTGVHLDGNMSKAGDPYERQANEIADKVVYGRQVARILTGQAGAAASNPHDAAEQREMRPQTANSSIDAVTIQRQQTEGPKSPYKWDPGSGSTQSAVTPGAAPTYGVTPTNACPSGTEEAAKRTVYLQPIFFRDSATDNSPTGKSWGRRLASANAIWGKLGVTFKAVSAIMRTDAQNKYAGSSERELDQIIKLANGAAIEVFMVDNPVSFGGGGGTHGRGSSSTQTVLSDGGTSDTLLAHELGHVLGLDHPPDGAEPNTVMEASRSHNSNNPVRNTIGNYKLIVWPAPGSPTCIRPDS